MKLSMHEIDSRQALLQCVIKDTGIGISRQNIKNLFKTFDLKEERNQPKGGHQAFSSTQGIGLGLSTTKSLVQMQGGSVRI